MKKILSILICVLLGVTTTYAADFTWNPEIKVTVSPHNESTGQGEITLTNTTPSVSVGPTLLNTESIMLSANPSYTTTGLEEVKSNNYNSISADLSATFTPNLSVAPSAGSFFDGWANAIDGEVLPTITIGSINSTAKAKGNRTFSLRYKYSWTLNGAVTPATYTIYAKFTARTYHAKWPKVVIVTQDAAGNVINSEVGGSISVTLKNGNTGTQAGVTGSKTYIDPETIPTDVFTQTADNRGKLEKASYIWNIVANTKNENYFVESLTYNSTSIASGTDNASFTDKEVGVSDPKQDVITVVFKQTFTAYFEGPSIAYASNSANNGSITIGNCTPITQVGKTINLKDQKGSVKDLLTYQYTYTAANTDKATFVGWSLNADGSNVIEASKGQLSYTHTFTITAGNYGTVEQPLTTPTLYAVYESFYYKCPVLKFAEGSNTLGKIAVSADGTVPATESSDWKTSDIDCGDAVLQVSTGGQTSKEILYHYHALANEGSIFIAFASDATGETTLSESSHYTRKATVSSKDINHPTDCPQYPVYAVFSENTPYWFYGASVGFTENGEKGIITLTGYTLSSNADDATQTKLDGYPKISEDEMIDDSRNTYSTQDNVRKYLYTYTAENHHPELTTFKGWSRSPRGGNIISEETSHTETYTSYATTKGGASAPAPLYAVFQSYWYKDAAATAVGAGQVVVNDEQTTPTAGWSANAGTDKLNQAPAGNEELTFTAWYHAKPNFGAYFAGWSLVNDANSIAKVITDNPYKKVYNVTATDDEAPFIPARLYAIFNSVIQVIQKDRMIYYVDVNGHKNINDANVIVNFNKASTLTATLKDNHDIFQLSDKQQVQKGSSITLDASAGISHLVLSYIGDDPESHIGKTATITLSSAYTDEHNVSGTATIDVHITIENMPYISFLPTDGKGAYTINQTNGSGINYTMELDATENYHVDISQENMATFELNITEIAAGYSFVGWQMIVDNMATYFSTNTKCTYTFTQSAYVRPVFTEINNDLGVFTIIGDETPYVDLQLALDEAKARYDKDANTPKSTQVVVFSNNGEIEGVLQQGHYTIPQGVMLLIPGVGPDPIQVEAKRHKDYPSRFGGWITDPFLMEEEKDLENGKNKYVYREKRIAEISEGKTDDVILFTDDYTNVSDGVTSSDAPYATCYRKLKVKDNTTFTVEDGGCIQLYAVLARNNQLYEASPYRYGQIELGENCRIDLQNGAALHAFGYITGAASSRVTAYSGAEVHELFQYSDPRGGTRVAHLFLCRDYYKVFPFSQYYIQNVEVPLEIQFGATEFITTTAEVLSPFVLMTEFIIPEDGDLGKTGLFRLGTNTSLVKQYNPQTDRLNITLQGTSASASARFGFINIEMGDLSASMVGESLSKIIDYVNSPYLNWMLGEETKNMLSDVQDVKLDSRQYVLPLNNNMDIEIDNANLIISNEFAFLAGSTMKLNDNATINLESGAKLYLYDADENKVPGSEEGYFSAGNNRLLPLRFTPNNTHLSDASKFEYKDENLKRKISAVKDAKWVVDGTINVQGGAGFYTTAGKAQIISTKEGRVHFETALDKFETYQAKRGDGTSSDLIDMGSYYNAAPKKEGVNLRLIFPVTSACLQNANGSHVETTKNTYTYDPTQGKWITDAPSTTIQGDEILVTMPDYDLSTEDIVDPLQTTLMSSLEGVSSATISWNGATATSITGITNDAAGVRIPLAYIPTNKAGEYEGLVSLNNGAYYQRINVVEDYTPRYTTISEVYATAYIGYSSKPVNLAITPEENNVAGILKGKYAADWSFIITGDNADEFIFTWGNDDRMLADANIVFKPKTDGSKTAQLALTCSYTDADGVKYTTCVQVPLTAMARTLTANTLAFAVDSMFIHSDATELFIGQNSDEEIILEASNEEVVEIEDMNGVWMISPKGEGSVTITAKQEADLENGIAGTTITKTITVTEDIVWNWKRLYFGTTNTNPVTVHEKISVESIKISANSHVYTEADGTTTTTTNGDRHDVVIKNEDAEYIEEVSIMGWNEGETQVWFTVFYYEGDDEELKSQDFKSEVYRDPRHLPISVNDNRVYEAVTWAQNDVKYSGSQVTFQPQSQWTFTFIGIPDLLSFKTIGNSGKWQIEESYNGTNWTITYAWAQIAATEPFEMELQPSTRYVRITFGDGAKGVLSDVTVSELTKVRADADKLYMPMVDEGNSTSKNVVFTYVSEAGFNLTTSDEVFSTSPNNLTGLATKPFYQIKQVSVSSTATNEMLGALGVYGTDLSIPIKVFTMPQAIPIQLASDEEERYYYVTTNTYNTIWDMDNRVVRMHNVLADASPYVVFHFADNPVPGVISFNYSASAQGTWLIQESANGTDWTTELTVNVAENHENKFVIRDFVKPETSRYVRVTYLSDYAEIVELTNLSILPTANATVNPSELIVYDTQAEKLNVTANNLTQVTFTLTEGFSLVDKDNNALDADALTALFVKTGGGTVSNDVYVQYTGNKLATYGTLNISTNQDAQGNDVSEKVLATVQLTGLKKVLPTGNTGIKTGTGLNIKSFDNTKEANLRDINVQYTYAANGGDPLFDYVIIYGETKTTDGATTVTAPTSTNGSNALTPCYIYQQKNGRYELIRVVENANSRKKSWEEEEMTTIDGKLKVYITGFCPYASTGYTKSDQGVWHFTGTSGDEIDIYLEDCYLYSRYKTKRGNSFSRSNGETYSGDVARGSGAVLLFENSNKEQAQTTPMEVTIHTRRENLLKSHYGCLFEHIVGRAFQVSAPVHIFMPSKDHYLNSYTELNFTDEWDGYAERTNGFISLQKQVNNAPSIDMGNTKTVVNFHGGQVELQNACNSSDNYESTLAISSRTGMYGPSQFRLILSRGIGTDDIGGTVNFYDGTTTVIPMDVPERYRQYYLMDENGTTTSCLRVPKNTFVYGGSHCMMRACSEPTSKGGAPTNGSKPLGLYKYPSAPYTTGEGDNAVTHKGGWTANGSNGLVTPTSAPDGYNVESVTPNTNGTVDGDNPTADDYLNFWVTEDYDDSVKPEVDAKISFWKACMTYIEAKYGTYSGSIGGATTIEFDNDGKQVEEVYNLLYCEIDNTMYSVINGEEGEYSAPVLSPAAGQAKTEDEKYLSIPPTKVGTYEGELKNYITNTSDYVVKNKVYYVVPAKADVWMAFTAPFDVENVYIMETRHEADLQADAIAAMNEGKYETYRAAMSGCQAKHNANFAAFFGVALALDSKKPFEDIFTDYISWANYQDTKQGLDKNRRNKYNLVHYNSEYVSTNGWDKADYYLYHNTGDWELTNDDAEGNQRFDTKWEFVTPIDGSNKVLMRQGETYSMLFPYCTGCGDELDSREYWDYWTGKLLIFESTEGGLDGHTIKGAAFVGSEAILSESNDGVDIYEWEQADEQGYLMSSILSRVTSTTAPLAGNPTFAPMITYDENVWTYSEYLSDQGFIDSNTGVVDPTRAFLYFDDASIAPIGQSVLSVGRDGMIVYRNNGGVTTGGHTPTVGGGNDLFITAISGGINVAVAAPQQVRVISSTGAVLYNGWVSTSVDVALPIDGIYIVSGENEVQKILY